MIPDPAYFLSFGVLPVLFKDPTKKHRTTCPMECVLLYGSPEQPYDLHAELSTAISSFKRAMEQALYYGTGTK